MNFNWKELEIDFVAYQNGDEQTVEGIFQRLSKHIELHLKLKGTRTQDAHDLSQDVLIKIHKARLSYDHKKPLKAWVNTITSRTLIDHWRKSKKAAFIDIHDIDQPSKSPGLENQILNKQGVGFIQKKINSMKPIDQEIVLLYAHDGKSMAEIAEKTGISKLAVKMRLFRIRKSLAKYKASILN